MRRLCLRAAGLHGVERCRLTAVRSRVSAVRQSYCTSPIYRDSVVLIGLITAGVKISSRALTRRRSGSAKNGCMFAIRAAYQYTKRTRNLRTNHFTEVDSVQVQHDKIAEGFFAEFRLFGGAEARCA